MKWIFIAFVAIFTPAAAAFLRSNPRYLLHACFVLTFAMFLPTWSVSPIFWDWPGPVQGLQVTFVDALAVAMIFSTPPVRIPAALKLAFGIYMLAIVISTFSAQQLMPVLFSVWQLMRAVLVFVAIARVTARHANAPLAVAFGLGCAIALESILVIEEYAAGNRVPGGTLGHRNFLGMASHFATMPAFALLLAGYRQRLAALTIFCGVIVALLGGSRATIGLLAFGILITTLLSMRHNMTGRKGAVAGAAALLILCSVPLMMWSIGRRSSEELQGSSAERNSMIQAARMIIADYPLGIGADQYVVVANVGGYADRAGVPWDPGNRIAPVHNSYFLITAELGFLGLIGFLATFAAVMGTGWNALRIASGPRSELLVGFLAAILIVAVHISFEWVFLTAPLQYLTACAFGAVVGIAASVRVTKRAEPRLWRGQGGTALAPEQS